MSKFCTEACRPCPPPIPGRGRGDSKCEQNGVCQLAQIEDAPQMKVTLLDNGTIDVKVERKPL